MSVCEYMYIHIHMHSNMHTHAHSQSLMGTKFYILCFRLHNQSINYFLTLSWLVSLFNGISNFMGYLIPKLSL